MSTVKSSLEPGPALASPVTKRRPLVAIDGNQAAAQVAHGVNEVIAIYPITPSSPMGELADEWSAQGRKNIWGTVPHVTEMQSEGGAAGALHGALQSGALCTTFTASQGLLLMIPNMHKIAGELTPTVFHVSSRSIAGQALSIFGDHSDVMNCRSTGWGMLASGSVQEVMDFALIATATTLRARVPFLHFFDGFRSSHEIQKIQEITQDDMRAMMDDDLIRAHRARALSPDHPFIRGTAQNPDVYFQAREAVNPYYIACFDILQETLDRFAALTNRSYGLFEYVGDPAAERVIVLMGSGVETAHETVEYLNRKGEKVGVIKVRLFRPFSAEHLARVFPKTVRKVAVLDRVKEPGSLGEPLYQDVVTALTETAAAGTLPCEKVPVVIGGRYGLSSKEFTPAMIKGIFDELAKETPKNHFTVGIHDDVTNTSISYDPGLHTESPEVVRAMFYGLGSDGTVGANKNSIKIIGEETDNYVQGYFVYDSRKAGTVTVSHLRFGPEPIRSTYLVNCADFIACHQWVFLERYDMLVNAVEGATFLLNSVYGPDEVWDQLPREVQEAIVAKKIKLHVIDAYEVARQAEMGGRINTIMQTCFFAISGVLPKDEGIRQIKKAIEKTYGKQGPKVVQKNFAAVDAALANLFQVKVPAEATSSIRMPEPVSPEAPPFVREVTAEIMAGRGDDLPVSKLPADGTFPSGTTRWEKRAIAQEIPIWDEEICVQCGKCYIVCPHAAIRGKIYDPEHLQGAPETFKSTDAQTKPFAGLKYTLQIAAEDCTGCATCVDICPVTDKKRPGHKAIDMTSLLPLREAERENFDHFLKIPNYPRVDVKQNTVKGVGLLEPLFEFSGACAGCGETPYLMLMTQLFGDRALVANATGCSSIYGGNLPTTPWAVNADGRGPAWSNSLFEDNAEFGLGFRLTVDKMSEIARERLRDLAGQVGDDLVKDLLEADQGGEAGLAAQRSRVDILKGKLFGIDSNDAKNLLAVADYLVKKSVWIVGGDGWAYDIGYGGLDHVLASGRNVNVLVLDTEVYSNTGGQASKATPRAAVAKFAASGRPLPKKDLALLAMTYGNVYVANVAMGGSDSQCVKAFVEAEAYDGPSLIVAYSHCIAHGIDMTTGTSFQKKAVDSGHWPLFRYNPDTATEGRPTLQLDSKAPSIPYEEFAYEQGRFRELRDADPKEAKRLLDLAQMDVTERWKLYEMMAKRNTAAGSGS